MTPTITGLLKAKRGGFHCQISPERVLTRSVSTGDRYYAANSNFDHGCQLHATLLRLGDAAPLNQSERAYWPFVAELRRALEELGVNTFIPERRLKPWGGLPVGVCDLKVFGGLARRGIVEVKIVGALPGQPLGSHLAQLGGYLRLDGRRDSFEQWWGALAYVSIVEKQVKIYAYRAPRRLILSAASVLQAA